MIEKYDKSLPKFSLLKKPKKSLFKSKGLQGKVYLIPSSITVLGIFCGVLGLVSAIKGNYVDSVKCIMLAILIDGLDGRVARRLNATSEFGKEFDSLSDLLTFGVTPAILVYQWAFATFMDDFGVLVCFVFVVASATRLARFNVNTDKEPQKKGFTGLPTTGAGAAVASVVYFMPQTISSNLGIAIMAIYMLSLSALLPSKLEYLSIKHVKFAQQNMAIFIVLLSGAVALTWYHSKLVFLLGTNLYAFSGVLLYIGKKFLVVRNIKDKIQDKIGIES